LHSEIAQLRSALQKRRPQPLPGEWLMQRAAVAAILRSDERGPQLLLIRRARRRGDPWSGDMAFPGGLVGRRDANPQAGALRETREEIGLDLARHGALLGELPRQLAFSPRPPWGPMAIIPYVFAIDGAPALVPDRREVEETIWVPLAHFAEPQHRERFTRRVLGLPLPFDCYRYEGSVVWGLTLRMIESLTADWNGAGRQVISCQVIR
jgi:8-oxo-dGTP pyrophosphatase MutT (NUDIX family)